MLQRPSGIWTKVTLAERPSSRWSMSLRSAGQLEEGGIEPGDGREGLFLRCNSFEATRAGEVLALRTSARVGAAVAAVALMA